MSGGSELAFAGLTKARSRLEVVYRGLREAASGAVLDRATAKVQQQIEAISRRAIGDHVYTGKARGSAKTTRSGGLIQHTTEDYLRYHSWWPFRRGMPTSVINNAAKIMERELAAALAGEPSPLATAELDAETAAAAKRAKEDAKKAKQQARYDAIAARGNAARARRQAEIDRMQARMDAARERRAAAGAKRQERYAASNAKLKERLDKRAAKASERNAKKLGKVRDKFKRDTAKIARRQAREAKRAKGKAG